MKNSQEIADRIGFADRVNRQPQAKLALRPWDQFGASKTINAKIMFKPAFKRDLYFHPPARVQFPHELANHGDQPVGADLTGPSGGQLGPLLHALSLCGQADLPLIGVVNYTR